MIIGSYGDFFLVCPVFIYFFSIEQKDWFKERQNKKKRKKNNCICELVANPEFSSGSHTHTLVSVSHNKQESRI